MTTKGQILKVIKEKCKEDCCAGDRESWINCGVKNCVLWQFRLGKDMNKSGRNPKKGFKGNISGKAKEDMFENDAVECEKLGKMGIVEKRSEDIVNKRQKEVENGSE